MRTPCMPATILGDTIHLQWYMHAQRTNPMATKCVYTHYPTFSPPLYCMCVRVTHKYTRIHLHMHIGLPLTQDTCSFTLHQNAFHLDSLRPPPAPPTPPPTHPTHTHELQHTTHAIKVYVIVVAIRSCIMHVPPMTC